MSSQVLATVEPKMQRAVEVMERDFTGLRTGRASTALVDRIVVEYYGTQTPLNQLAGISVPEPFGMVRNCSPTLSISAPFSLRLQTG